MTLRALATPAPRARKGSQRNRGDKTMSEERTSREAPADVHALLERIEESWRQLFAVLDDIPEERMSDPGVIGEWSLKDLFGHLAFWDDHATEEIERALAGL